jgi:hypothetical protein
MQDILKKISEASATKGGNDFRKGKYRLTLQRCSLQKARKGDALIIPEFRVKTAEKTDQGVEPNAVGSSARFIWNITKHDAAAGNVKTFVLALVGMEESQVTAEQVQHLTAVLVSDEQPFAGLDIDMSTFTYVNKGRDVPENKGKEMILPNWEHVPGQTEATRDANRAAAPAPAPQPEKPVAPPPPVATPPASGFLAGMFNK